ncbi:2OG-Fe(II) oxygenase [Alteromonas macleodii]|uniref:2OG-Fe(II) oxygenase n=1 Tax=Alteromonas macleodii TaxID=28108 RepID=UPI00066EC9D1|nr:2OG-Fe(II) oxygenase [Alteromonas macleodii]CAI3952280.1 SM-20-related protein [Alteromonas macleodii]VTP52174.1 SM-20-related protein [Alteromonas macleodii]
MNREQLASYQPLHVFDEAIFENIVDDLVTKGFSIQEHGLPDFITQALLACQRSISEAEYQAAGIGRAENYQKAEKVRGDEICWITGSSSEGALWLSWCEAMQQYVNRSLFMGLFSFESHFACYEPGKFYKRHVDAFKGQGNRVLSLVAYLNDDWTSEDGGELVLYADESDLIGTRVLPTKSTFVVFLSEQFPHEVLPAARSRHSVAGWFRVNGSVNDAIDPPR